MREGAPRPSRGERDDWEAWGGDRLHVETWRTGEGEYSTAEPRRTREEGDSTEKRGERERREVIEGAEA